MTKAQTLAEASTALVSADVQYALLDHHVPDGLGRTFGSGLPDPYPGLRVMLMGADPTIGAAGLRDASRLGDRIRFMAKALPLGAVCAWFAVG